MEDIKMFEIFQQSQRFCLWDPINPRLTAKSRLVDQKPNAKVSHPFPKSRNKAKERLTSVWINFNKSQRERTTDVRLLALLNACLTEPQQERPTLSTYQLLLCIVF